MNKEDKKKLIEVLESDNLYTSILTLVPNESEKKKVKAFVEDVYVKLVDALTQAAEAEIETEKK